MANSPLSPSSRHKRPSISFLVSSTDLDSSNNDIFGSPGVSNVIRTVTNSGPLMACNRGEIAIRIVRAAHELGLKAISIYSAEDKLSMHRYKADESYQIGEQGQYSPVGAYLAQDEILRIAKQRNVIAIHPGYGFLSENAEFAKKCQESGIAFVGPTPEVINRCGDKTLARDLALKCGVPVVPGSDGPVKSVTEAEKFIEEHGLPIIIKAAMGGGGRGMRVVRFKEELAPSYERCVSEAKASFGDGTVFIERFVEKPRHIEVQLLGDNYGNVIHLFDRDCSVQRRHQKVVEMAPARNLPDSVRASILNDAIKLAKGVGYRNAGTAEFLVDLENRYYFIEINPRVQVEHTVTEEITGIDIVGSQIRIALGESLADLGLTQESVKPRGYAIQCRVTTEDPFNNFQPDTGRIEVYRSASGNGVRLDGGPGYSGAILTPFYDSLLVKVTCHSLSFDSARRKMLRALVEFRVRGLKTNIPFMVNLLQHPTFINGDRIWTTFIDDTRELLVSHLHRNRGQKLLRYLGSLVVNGSKIKGQKGIPTLNQEIHIPILPGIPADATSSPYEKGWRNILLQEGPEAFCKAIRSHKGGLIMDTTWRDAHQSLLATRVRTIDMARIAKTTSHGLSNLFALECWGGATFDVSMRFLNEDPWDRLKTLRSLVPNIPFSMLLRGANAVGYTAYPDNVIYEFCRLAKKNGMDIFRIFDSLNYEENLKLGIDAVKRAGGVVEAAISYTGDVSDLSRKRYNLEYYLNLASKLVEDGIHILAIKDMAGLLKPKAARLLIGGIREKYPDLVIHVHTHDTAGTGVASMLACLEAGADIVDAAIDSMSGTTSQPSMGAIVGALEGTSLDTGLKSEYLHAINGYWEQVRLLYDCFDPGVKSGDSEVYTHEMPGGQYTNLLFQSQQLGLGDSWRDIKVAYATANRLCGDIVKVTPSSKVVGDLAQFIVSQKLTEQEVIDKAETLSFPTSVVEYFQGYLGIPPYGFPEPLRSRILSSRKLKPLQGRPGASLPELDLVEFKKELIERYGEDNIRDEDVISAALYPKVFDDFKSFKDEFGDLSPLPTHIFLRPLKVGEEIGFNLEQGKTLYIGLTAIGQLNSHTQRRDVFFMLNGEARVVGIEEDEKEGSTSNGAGKTHRLLADPKNKGHVAAAMAGVIVELRVQEGSDLKVGDPVAVMSAMKMETVVSAQKAGKITKVHCKDGDSLNAGDLIAEIE